MKTAIMQPYFLPYIGYWQLINNVDEFVIYDNIQYTKNGWINRNRYLLNEKDCLFTIPLKSDSNNLNIVDRYISENYDKNKLLNKFINCYKKALYFKNNFDIIEEIIRYDENNLFLYNLNSVKLICSYLDIKTKISISSSINIDHKNLKAQDKVISICKELKSNIYINAIGGIDLYNKNIFEYNGLSLNFIKSNNIEYKQFDKKFVPWLSILDVMMFNSKEDIKNMLNQYQLIEGK